MSHVLEHLVVGESSLDIAVVPSTYNYYKGRYDRVVLIAGGTGITPLIHVSYWTMPRSSTSRLFAT
jgi:ferredoxin-NADP reductase